VIAQPAEAELVRSPRDDCSPCTTVLAAENKCLARNNKSRTGVPATNKATGSAAHFLWRCQLAESPLWGLSAAGLSLPFGGASRAEVNMSWHHPDLYFFLGLLTGLAAFLAIIYECIQRFRRRKPPVVLPLDGLQRDRPARPTEERASKRPSDFSRL
jgi:hypothetical protein